MLRRHLAECEACRLFGAEVKRQRAALALVLPVMPTGVLKLGAASAFAASRRRADWRPTGGAPRATVPDRDAVAGIAAKLGVPAALLKGAAATLAVTTVAAGGVATTAQVAQDVTRDSRAADRAAGAAVFAARTGRSRSPRCPRAAPGRSDSVPGAASPGKPARQAAPDGAALPGRSSAPGAAERGPGSPRSPAARSAEGPAPKRQAPLKAKRPRAPYLPEAGRPPCARASPRHASAARAGSASRARPAGARLLPRASDSTSRSLSRSRGSRDASDRVQRPERRPSTSHRRFLSLHVKVGVPKETKPGERRVALVPDSVKKLADAGFEVVVERGAGREANLTDAEYEEAGATLGDASARGARTRSCKVAAPGPTMRRWPRARS